ncbi:MAG: divalent-cation tolerance protein CutA, partial [Blastocatellia bacterium]
IYTWQGATEHADERQLLIKTATHRVKELETRLKQLHPYDIPEFLVMSVLEGSGDYLSWLAESTSPVKP